MITYNLNVKLITFMLLLFVVPIDTNSKNKLKLNQQEICLLINVLDHNYENIDRESFDKINAIGYRTIELGNYMKPLSKELTGIVTGLKFNTLACGGSLWELQNSIDSVIQRGKLLHQKYIICYWPWLDSAENVTVDQCKKSADIMNILGEKCHKSGLKFAFHNHSIEFRKIEGKYVCDYLLEYTNPSFVSLEFDIYFALKANSDPLYYMDKHKERIDILHLFAIDEKKSHPVVGDGMRDFVKIIRKSNEIGVKYLVVEGNDLKNPMRYVEESYNRLKKLTH